MQVPVPAGGQRTHPQGAVVLGSARGNGGLTDYSYQMTLGGGGDKTAKADEGRDAAWRVKGDGFRAPVDGLIRRTGGKGNSELGQAVRASG